MLFFGVADSQGIDITVTTLDETGHAAGEERTRAKWAELSERTAFPAAASEIGDELLTIEAGKYPTRRYVVRDGATTSTYWFARSVAGIPVCTTVEREGRLIERRELFREIL